MRENHSLKLFYPHKPKGGRYKKSPTKIFKEDFWLLQLEQNECFRSDILKF